MSDDEFMHVGEYHENQNHIPPAAGFSCGVGVCQPASHIEISDDVRLAQINHTVEPGQTSDPAEGKQWEWGEDGTLKLTAQQPKVYVPLIQEVQRRDLIVEVPKVEVVDAVKAHVYSQDVKHEVPVVDIETCEEEVVLPRITYIDREVVVPIVTGYTHKFVPKWEIREVPRPVIKYVGVQRIIEVDVPQLKFVDKIVEKELVIDTVEKRVPKIIEQEKEIETVKYVWKPIEKIIHVDRYVPRYDVSLECPAPLIVPYTVPRIKQLPSAYVRQNEPANVDYKRFEDDSADALQHMSSPPNTLPIKGKYIQEYSKLVEMADQEMAPPGRSSGGSFGCMNACNQDFRQYMSEPQNADVVMQNVPPPPHPDIAAQRVENGNGGFLHRLQMNLQAAEANVPHSNRSPDGLYSNRSANQPNSNRSGDAQLQYGQQYYNRQNSHPQNYNYMQDTQHQVPPPPSTPGAGSTSPYQDQSPRDEGTWAGRLLGGMFNR